MSEEEFNKRKFEAGGLVVSDTPVLAVENFPARFDPPKRFDNRGYIPDRVPDDQGSTSWCVAYAFANFKEVYHWRKEGWRQDIDEKPIYRECKRIDGNNNPGTSLESGFKAMQNLGHFPKTWRYEVTRTLKGVQYAMHLMLVCVSGFMITEEWSTISNRTGFIANKPNARKIGGHAVLTHSLKLLSNDSRENWIGPYTPWGRIGWRKTGYFRMTEEQWIKQHLSTLIIYET